VFTTKDRKEERGKERERDRERQRKREKEKKGETNKANGRESIPFSIKGISSAQLNLLPEKKRFFS